MILCTCLLRTRYIQHLWDRLFSICNPAGFSWTAAGPGMLMGHVQHADLHGGPMNSRFHTIRHPAYLVSARTKCGHVHGSGCKGQRTAGTFAIEMLYCSPSVLVVQPTVLLYTLCSLEKRLLVRQISSQARDSRAEGTSLRTLLWHP